MKSVPRRYHYVGPPDIREAAIASTREGSPIRSTVDLTDWMSSRPLDLESDGSLIATFVVNSDGILLLAPRRSEHIACDGGDSVLSAGEITISSDVVVIDISNQSTGFCPELESWPTVAAAIDAIPVERPDDFTIQIVFRLCPSCNERNIVKDGWFYSELCGNDLPHAWNFPVSPQDS